MNVGKMTTDELHEALYEITNELQLREREGDAMDWQTKPRKDWTAADWQAFQDHMATLVQDWSAWGDISF